MTLINVVKHVSEHGSHLITLSHSLKYHYLIEIATETAHKHLQLDRGCYLPTKSSIREVALEGVGVAIGNAARQFRYCVHISLEVPLNVFVPVFETLRNRAQLLFISLLDVLFTDKMPQLHREFRETLTLDEVLVDRIHDDLAVYQHLEIDQILSCLREDTPIRTFIW